MIDWDIIVGKLCLLCKNSSEVIKSHIIPEYMYKPIYGKQGKVASAGRFKIIKGKITSRNFMMGKGDVEYLLCKKCDNEIIGGIEGEAIKYIDLIRDYSFSQDLEIIETDYKIMKLFQLSLLWRAPISTNWMFKNVSLGNKHEEKIRLMLKDKNPGRYYEYGCVIIVVHNKLLRKSMIHSQRNSHKKHTIYQIVTPGIHFEYYVSSHTKNIDFVNLFLNEDGYLPLIRAPKDYEDDSVRLLKRLIYLVKDNKIENSI